MTVSPQTEPLDRAEIAEIASLQEEVGSRLIDLLVALRMAVQCSFSVPNREDRDALYRLANDSITEAEKLMEAHDAIWRGAKS